eukprot:CAMPEP_0184713948 /NCGR_PEP_ID=MMETSP0314-20130426/4213_1 /TAXON_ID=38298 /ORGANISM="Rhodella maculata, Strain CCMP 736" /LENGTH=115 /DNA_ID=CAMNT_0027176737 /DNA_START=77 /DNA_END=424 /DNA_ORIENTATION=+
MAFVSSFTVTPTLASSHIALSPLRAPAPTRRSAPAMMASKKPSTPTPSPTTETVEANITKSMFSLKAEQLNGRAAMAGFVIALVTEVVNPSHATIVQQVEMVLPFLKFFNLPVQL